MALPATSIDVRSETPQAPRALAREVILSRLGSLFAVAPLGVWTVMHLWHQLAAYRSPQAWTEDVENHSSDAGAALRLLNALHGLGFDDTALESVAAGIGADGAACLRARLLVAEGRGEQLSAAPAMPPLPAVLVNPGVPSPTGPVRIDQSPSVKARAASRRVGC